MTIDRGKIVGLANTGRQDAADNWEGASIGDELA